MRSVRVAGGWSILFALVGAAAASGLTDVAVKADRVNLRAAPSLKSEVVGQVQMGDVLAAKSGLDGEWIEIVPPAGVALWVFGDLVKDGAVTVAKLRVRGGPGINYSPVGTLTQGQKVTLLGATGEWLKIAPPVDCSLWVSREYVAALSDGAAARPPSPSPGLPVAPAPAIRTPQEMIVPPPKPASSPWMVSKPSPPPIESAAPPAPLDVPPALEGQKLLALPSQGRRAEFSGTLSPAAPVWRRPSRYVLIQRDERGRVMPECYLLGNDAQLSTYVGRTLRVRGREYRLQGIPYPAIVLEEITLRN
jgi:hypothetical protein